MKVYVLYVEYVDLQPKISFFSSFFNSRSSCSCYATIMQLTRPVSPFGVVHNESCNQSLLLCVFGANIRSSRILFLLLESKADKRKGSSRNLCVLEIKVNHSLSR